MERNVVVTCACERSAFRLIANSICSVVRESRGMRKKRKKGGEREEREGGKRIQSAARKLKSRSREGCKHRREGLGGRRGNACDR